MPDWLLRVEAVNFAATMDDTSDLSTQRGASLVALNAGEAVRRRLVEVLDPDKKLGVVERIYVGASQALFRLKAGVDPVKALDETRRYLATMVSRRLNRPLYPKPQEERAPPVAMMTFVAEVEEDQGDEQVLDRLEARLRRLQFQSPTLPRHGRARADRPFACPVEHRLPADRGISVRLDMYENAMTLASYAPRDEKVIAVSRSVAERRSYGRSARQRFYDHELRAASGLHFADGLIDLVNAHPDTVPLPLRGKMAVVSADGIGFGELLGKAKDDAGNAIAGLKRFSGDVEKTNREDILRPLIGRLAAAAADTSDAERRQAVSLPWEKADNPKAFREQWSPILRFETLTYAGEDIVWLMPAWLAWEVVGFLFQATEGASIAKRTPAYRVGCVVCSHKMPIRKAKGLAHELAYLVTEGVAEKAAGLQLELVESIDVSDGYLGAHRARLAGPAGPERFTVKGASHAAVTAHVQALRHPKGLPPSQLHRLLRLAAGCQAFSDASARAEVEAELEETLKRGGYSYGSEALTKDQLAFEPLGAGGDALFGLLRLAQLWDVVLPLGRPVLPDLVQGEP